MTDEEGNEKGLLKYTKYIMLFTVIIVFLNVALIIQQSGFRFPYPSGNIIHISPVYGSTEYEIPSLEIPTEYFVVTYLSIPQTTSYEESMEIGIELENRGKMDIQNVFIQLLVVDPLGIIRGSLSKDASEMTEIQFSKLEKRPWYNPFREETYIFKMPSADQKVYGEWRIHCLVRNLEGELISYAICPAEVTYQGRNSFIPSLAIGIITSIAIGVIFTRFFRVPDQ